MTELVSKSASITDLYKRIGFYKASPVRIAQATFEYFDDIMNNRVDLVDPTNPFIMLIEASSVHSALAVNESLLNLKRSYVGLAETNEDVYRHMTDSEFVGRFANPGNAPFTFMFDLNSLYKAMVQDPSDNCSKAILPRDTVVSIDTYTFTFEYPIVFRKFPNGVLQITYDTTIPSPISKPSNNVITFKVRQDNTGMKWLYFTIPLKQMKISSSNYAIQRESVFSKDILFEDQFVYSKVFQKSEANQRWVELYTTHSDQVFDKTTPTAILKVTEGKLNVTIPFIYNTLGTITGQIRIDVYTSKGGIDVNLSSYTLEKFSVKLRNLDTLRDDNAYTSIWSDINYFGFSDKILEGGSSGISFEELKSKVINYAFGSFNVPITTSQLHTLGELNGFKIVRTADGLTDRYLLGIRSIPDITIKDTSANTQKLLSRANIGMIRFLSDVSELKNSDTVVNNGDRLTLLSNSAFLLDNGKASLVEHSDILGIKAQPVSSLVSTVNSSSYVYTPFYYVLDLNETLLSVRPYDLDHPDSANLNFVSQNNTLGLVVNTGSYLFTKTGTGYKLKIVTISGSAYKQLNDNQVAVQMRLSNKDGSLVGTINGELQGIDPDTEERIYTFDLHTTYDVNKEHAINIINVYNNDGVINNFFCSLNSIIDIIYTTTSLTTGYVADITDTLINKNKLPVGSAGNSHDTLELFFGEYLKHLWTRSRTYSADHTYQTSPVDVPALYEKDIYEINPITGSMLFIDGTGTPYYKKIHSRGDPVLNYVTSTSTGINIYSGSNAPTNDIGSNGDYYIKTTDGDFYGPKSNDIWPLSPNASNCKLHSGSGTPNNANGVTNDYYVDTNNGNFYGPKSSGSWPVTSSFKVNPVLKYKAGDTILDNNGDPLPVSQTGSKNDFDFLVIDGALLFATDPNYISYRDQITKIMAQWITTDILEIQNKLVERTEIFFYPLSTLGLTQITINGRQSIYLESQQSPVITVFLDESVVNDLGVQTAIVSTISTYLDTKISQLKFTVNQLESDLKTALGNNVFGVTISNIGGTRDYKSININDQHNRLCIKRKLVANTDNSITIQPNYDIVIQTF